MDVGYCAIISKYRLYQGLALYSSLESNTKDFVFFVLCMDEEVSRVFEKLKLAHLIHIPLKKVEHDSLSAVKKQRSIGEYCYTLKPAFIKYLFNNFQNIERVTYLDADLYFFSDPALIYMEDNNSSVLLSRHDYNYDDIKNDSQKFGKYNSGLISFKRDKISWACLDWWEKRCMEWCFDKVEDGKFTDQKYIEYMAEIFRGIGEINTPGVNVAFWNQVKYKFSIINNDFYVNEHKLICYHYSLFRMISKYKYVIGYSDFIYRPMMHIPYGVAVYQEILKVQNAVPGFNGFLMEEELKGKESAKTYTIKYNTKNLLNKLKEYLSNNIL